LKVRRQVKTISLDLNAGYINLVPKLFPKAKVVVDRFHIAQMMNRSLNSTRIQVMKRMPKRSKEYLFMKRDWKKFLESFDSIEKIKSSAYGYRSWNNFTERINIQMFWIRASSSAK
jgi:transposase